jgi:Na+-driven multidrug efflux pump
VQTGLAWCLRLPLAFLLGVHLGGGVLGAWLGELLYLLVLAIAFVHRFHSGAWQRVTI